MSIFDLQRARNEVNNALNYAGHDEWERAIRALAEAVKRLIEWAERLERAAGGR